MWMPYSNDFVHPTSCNNISTGTVIKCVHSFWNGNSSHVTEKIEYISTSVTSTSLAFNYQHKFIFREVAVNPQMRVSF